MDVGGRATPGAVAERPHLLPLLLNVAYIFEILIIYVLENKFSAF